MDRLPLRLVLMLRAMGPEEVARLIRDEHPGTGALTLLHVPVADAEGALRRLPEEKRLEITAAWMGLDAGVKVPDELVPYLEGRIAALLCPDLRKPGAVDRLMELHDALVADKNAGGVLEILGPGAPGELAQKIQSAYQLRRRSQGKLVLEDLLRAEDKGVQNLLKELDPKQLALALKNAPPAVSQKIFRNMSNRAAAIVRQEMEFLKEPSPADMAAAQHKVLNTASRLAASGEVVFAPSAPAK